MLKKKEREKRREGGEVCIVKTIFTITSNNELCFCKQALLDTRDQPRIISRIRKFPFCHPPRTSTIRLSFYRLIVCTVLTIIFQICWYRFERLKYLARSVVRMPRFLPNVYDFVKLLRSNRYYLALLFAVFVVSGKGVCRL